MNSKRLSELRYKGYITDSEYKELKLAIKALEERPLAITNEDIHLAIKEGFANGYSMAKAKYERPTVVAKNATSDRPQGKWYEYIDKGLLKARHGDYALYKVDFLLDNLAREVNIMESARQMTCGADMRVKSELKDELNELKEAENEDSN